MSRKTPKKDCIITMRVKRKQLDLIDWAANDLGISRSEFILQASRREALRIFPPILVQP